MLEPENILICVTQDPWPDAHHYPAFVKEAFCNLKLTARWFFEPDQCPSDYPRGAYMVDVAELLRAMAGYNFRAYQYLKAEWDPFDMIGREHNDIGIQLPFPREYCDEVVS